MLDEFDEDKDELAAFGDEDGEDRLSKVCAEIEENCFFNTILGFWTVITFRL